MTDETLRDILSVSAVVGLLAVWRLYLDRKKKRDPSRGKDAPEKDPAFGE